MPGRASRRRPWSRLALAGAALTAGLSSLAFAAAPAGAQAGLPAAVPSALPVSVQLRGLSPVAPQPGDVLTLTGTLHNVSTQPVRQLSLLFRYRPDRIGSRSEFDGYAGEEPDQPFVGTQIAYSATATPKETNLQPGTSEGFTIKVPVNSLGLPDAWQVYQIGVEVRGYTRLGYVPVGRLRTYLPYAPVDAPGVGQPTQVAWLWPLADRPHRSVGDTWLDDGLAPELAANGRLASLVAAGHAAETRKPTVVRHATAKTKSKPATTARPAVTPVPVTWAIDPLLVDDVESMAAGYRVGTGRDTKPGTGKAAATAWLAQLRAAVQDREVLSLPYADPDVVAAVRAGLGSEVQAATNTGQILIGNDLSVTPLTYAWPPSGQLDLRTLNTLFDSGVSTVVLDSSALPIPGDQPNETPSARTTVQARDGNLDALLVDDGIRQVVQEGADDPSLAALKVQQFLAEMLMIQAERPSDQRTIVVAPDRRWAPTPSYARKLLAVTSSAPWISPISLSDAAAGPIYTKVERGQLTYAADSRRSELPKSYLAVGNSSVVAVKRAADAFAEILVLPDGAAPGRTYDRAVMATLSSAWRTDPRRARVFRDAVGSSLLSTMRQVHIASSEGSFVTLTSHSGTVPVTVANELDTPVRVVVAIKSLQLSVSGTGRTTETIQPHRQIPIDVRATAQTSGVFPLTVSLFTPAGQAYGPPVNLYVRSTAYGIVAILITAGATAALLLAVVVRLTRRALAARHSARSA